MIICILYQLPNKTNYSLKPTFPLGIATLFLLNLLLCGSRFLKKIINFSGLRFRYHKLANRKRLILSLGNSFQTHWHCQHITFWVTTCQRDRPIMVSKYGYLMLSSGTFPDNVIRNFDFIDEAVVQCDVPVVKILL